MSPPTRTSELLEAPDTAGVLDRAAHCIAQDLLRLEQQFSSDPVGVAGKVPKTFRATATSLFDSIIRLYVPDFDEDLAHQRLLDRESAHTLSRRPGLAARDDHGNFRQLSLEDLLTLAARGMASELDDARGRLREPPQVTTPETVAAWSDWFETVTKALGSVGPLRICLKLRPLLARWSPTTKREDVFEVTSGRLFSVPATALRSLIGHALAETLEVFACLFPGVLTAARGTPGRTDSSSTERATSPFRVRQSELSLGDEFDMEAAALLTRSGASAPFQRTIQQLAELASLQGAQARAKQRVKLLDLLNVFSDSAEETVVARIESRARWQEARLKVTLLEWAQSTETGFRNVETHRRLKAVYDATLQVRAVVVSTPSPFSFGFDAARAEVFGHELLNQQLAALEPLGSIATGLRGGLPHLAAQLTTSEPLPAEDGGPVVTTLRHALEATSNGRNLLTQLRYPTQHVLANLLDFASAHPASALYFSIPRFMQSARGFLAHAKYDSGSKSYRGVLYGQNEFLDAFAIWARDLMRTTGPAISANQFLELAMLKKLEAVDARTGASEPPAP